ncbi:Sfi1 spindle body [Neofusicoccum parvum]|nr:Sfi1 spindle body [Neofusicoccum parvum]
MPAHHYHPEPVDDDFLPLSNQDVEILYTIVTTAARLGDGVPPYRALFTAYDLVLAERRIDPNQDRVYFRFLLRMRNVAGAGTDDGTHTLYGRFESLLADMGIQLEVDEHGDGGVVEDVTRRFDELELDEEAVGGSPGLATPGLPALSRRASFDDTTMHQRTRPWDDSSSKIAPAGRHQHAGIGAQTGRRRSSSRASDPAHRRRPSERDPAARPAMHSGFPHRGRLSSRGALDRPSQSRVRRARSLSSQGSIRITRTEEIQRPAREPGFYDVDDFSTLPSRRSSISGPGPEDLHYVPPEMLYRPSPTQMLADADTFLYARTLFNARRALQAWRDQAMVLQERRLQMEEAAELFNKKKRADAALEVLSVTMQERQAERALERFFERMGVRAGGIYTRSLKMRMFGTWRTNTLAALEKTQVARQRVLKAQLFSAWYHETAVKELKVQRFQTKRFFGAWRRRHSQVQEENDLALAFRSENLIQETYQACFWEFLERKAVKLHDSKVKRRVFAQMIGALLQITERDAAVEERTEQRLKAKMLHLLANKMLNSQALEPAAENFRKQKLLAHAFGNVKMQAKLQPLERQFSQQVLQSRAREILSVWHVRAGQSQLATWANRTRVLRNAFTAWNDNLRCLALRSRINERVAFEALQKWALEARAALFVRVRNVRIKKSAFQGWANKLGDRQGRLERAERMLTASRETRLKRSAFNKLRGAFEAQKQREAQALAVYEPRLLTRTWPKVVARHQHVQQLEQWGSDAQFYTVATHALKRWKESTHHAQRMRRREAYTTIRRRTKMSIARRAFERWRSKSSAIEFMDRQAQELQENAVLRSATRLLDQWHDTTISFMEKVEMADSFRKRKLLSSMLGAWEVKVRALSRDEEKAVALLEVHVGAEASVCLKKLNWRLFQYQRQEQSGYALAERNFEKHVKIMLRHWADRTNQSRRKRGVDPVLVFGEGEGQQRVEEESVDVGGRDAGTDEHDANIARNEEWAPLDSSALDVGDLRFNLDFDNRPVLQPRPSDLPPQEPNPFAMTIRNPDAAFRPLGVTNISTPLPGYLRSPSKRSTVRAAKARERLAALTVTTGNNENRAPHPLSNTLTTTSGAAPSATATAPSNSASTFALRTNTGSTTPMAAPSGFGGSVYGFPATTTRAADTVIQAPGTAPAATTTTAFIPDDGARNFGASTMLAATPAANKSAITPFARKLTAQGYANLSRPESSSAARPTSSSRTRSRGLGGVGLGLAGNFSGFEDIAEDEGTAVTPARRGGGDGRRSGESSP